MRTYPATAALAVVFAFIAKDLAVPLLAVSLFGLLDRLIFAPRLRTREG